MKILYVLTLSLFLSGCFATGEKFKLVEGVQGNRSVIYLYRDSGLTDYGGAFPDFKLDGKGKYPLKNGGYYRFDVSPGKHKLEIISEFQLTSFLTWPNRSIEIEAATGREYFIRYDVYTEGYSEDTSGLVTKRVRQLQTEFKIVKKEAAIKELLNTRKAN